MSELCGLHSPLTTEAKIWIGAALWAAHIIGLVLGNVGGRLSNQKDEGK